MTISVLCPDPSVEWATPLDVFTRLDTLFGFTLDACATPENALCSRYYTRADDGLSQPWAPHITWCNPPYGREIGKWMWKAYTESQRGAVVACLVPASCDTRWWHDHVKGKAHVTFFKGRLRFRGLDRNRQQCAPFASAVVVYRPWRDDDLDNLLNASMGMD